MSCLNPKVVERVDTEYKEVCSEISEKWGGLGQRCGVRTGVPSALPRGLEPNPVLT